MMVATANRDLAGDAGWRLCVAPMMDWTTSPCRVFHRILAPGARLYSEMLHARAVIHGQRERLLALDPSEHPVALQLGGSEPDRLAEAAAIGEDWGYDEINLNCGCPSDRVQAGRFGACLMREPGLVAECVAALRAAVRIPVTVKCRIGVDEQEDYASLLGFIDTVAAADCDTFIVHARKAWLKGLSPKENREVPPLREDLVVRLKRERPDLRIVLNGGITVLAPALAHLEQVDGVMLGRAAWHDPYLLHRIDARLRGAVVRSRRDLLAQYLAWVERQGAPVHALRRMLAPVLGLYRGQPGGRRFRRLLGEWLARPPGSAGSLDQILAAAGDEGLAA